MEYIYDVIIFVVGIICGIVLKGCVEKDKKKIIASNENNRELFHLMNKWVKAKQKQCDFADYFKRREITSIAVYGMSFVGQTFIEELEDTSVKVLYAIDKNPEETNGIIKTMSPNDKLHEVDAVVVTAVYYFDEIEELLSQKMDCPIISVEDIVTDALFFESKK